MVDKSVTSDAPLRRAQWLKALTCPESVAIIGASDDEAKLQARPMRFLARHGFAGRVLPINPGRSTVLGLPAWPNLSAAPGPIDHAYVLLNTDAAVDAVGDCAAQGVKAVTVLADGFAESGPAGIARQQRLASIARDANMLLIGPNSTGVVDTRSGFSSTTNAAFATDKPPIGKMAVISQSGSMIGAVFSRGCARGLCFSTLVSVGNEAVSGVGELGDLLLDDPDHDAFLLFMETVRNPRALAAFARRAHELGKPVVCYMIGRSDEGQALSATHTGAMMGSGRAVSSFFRRHGIIEVENFEALLESPGALLRRPAIADRPRHVTVLTTTGGGGAMVVDKLGERGVAIAGCSAQTRQALEAQKVPLGHGKLIDVTLAGARYESMKAVISTLIADPHTGVLLVAIGSSAQFEPERAVKPLIDAVATAPATAAPVLAFPLPHAEESLRLFSEAGIPAFQTLESCVESVAMLMGDDALEPPYVASEQLKPQCRGSEVSARLSQIEPRANGLLNEVEASGVFAAAGLSRPPQVFVSAGESVPDSLPFEFPAVVKVVSPDLAHKSDVGGVQLNLTSIDEVRHAVGSVQQQVRASQPDAQIDGALIQAMQTGVQEMLVGLTHDPLVGPMITVGFGGMNTEIYRDTVVEPAPVSTSAATKMVHSLRGAPLLRGYRGRPSADIEALIAAVVAVSELAKVELIQEAEINPLLVCKQGQGVVMLDALVRCTPASMPESEDSRK